MAVPGDGFRRRAIRVFSAATMERVIDPILADLQSEYAQAIRHGRPWTSRWVQLVAYVALCKAMVFYACDRSVRIAREWPADPLVGRTIACSAAAIVPVMLLVMLPAFHQQSGYAYAHPVPFLVYFAPQALAIAVPVGLMLGILYGVGGRAVPRRSIAAIATLALVLSVLSFVNNDWILAAANQGFRVVEFGPNVTKGPTELTLRELSHAIDASTRAGLSTSLLGYTYHLRWALSGATLVLAVFALSVVTRRSQGRATLGIMGVTAPLVYYGLLYVGRAYVLSGPLPVVAVAWLPNIVMAGVSLVLWTRPPVRSVSS